MTPTCSTDDGECPVRGHPGPRGSLSEEVPKAVDALEAFDVTHGMTPRDTVSGAMSTDERFEATEGANDELDGEWIETPVGTDQRPAQDRHLVGRVQSVERVRGREPRG